MVIICRNCVKVLWPISANRCGTCLSNTLRYIRGTSYYHKGMDVSCFQVDYGWCNCQASCECMYVCVLCLSCSSRENMYWGTRSCLCRDVKNVCTTFGLGVCNSCDINIRYSMFAVSCCFGARRHH